MQIVEVEESECKGIHYKHYLLQVSPSVFDSAGEEVQVVDEEQPPQQAYLRPGHLLQLDTFLCTHSIGSALYGMYIMPLNILTQATICQVSLDCMTW